MQSYELEMVLFGIYEIHLVEKYTPKIVINRWLCKTNNFQLKMIREIISFFTHNFENYELNMIRA